VYVLSRVWVVLVAFAALLVAASPTLAAFPGENGRIAFDAQNASGLSDLFTIRPDGTELVDLTNTSDNSEFGPAWSADGTKLAFSAVSPSPFRIYVMNADGTGRTQVGQNGPLEYFYAPKWSPDGSKLVFNCEVFTRLEPPRADDDICVMNADGSARVNLTGDITEPAFDPEFSPDGTKIAFSTFTCQGINDCSNSISVMNSDGSEKVKLATDASVLAQAAPSWSPDGSWIAFATRSSVPPAISDVYVMRPDGSGRAQLTFTGTAGEPAWSPDGTRIAFVSGAAADLFTIRIDGTGLAQLTSTPTTFEFAPNWQPLSSPLLPPPSSEKNPAKFCEAERVRLGDAGFRARYGTNGNGSNASGRCISEKARK
jgi:TolB protein